MSIESNWLSELSTENDVWVEKKELENIPSMIVSSYLQLSSLVQQGQVYGTMFLLKDIYELLLKIPLVMSLISIENCENDIVENGYIEIIQETLKAPMSMGAWHELAIKMISKHEELKIPAELYSILTKTSDLYQKKVGNSSDVVNWRNDVIGHGITKFKETKKYQAEFRALIKNLKYYFTGKRDSLSELYQEVYFISGNKKLVGDNNICPKDINNISLYIKGNCYPVVHFVEPGLYIFDSYYCRKKLTQYCSSIDENSRIVFSDYFEQLYYKYVFLYADNNAVSASFVRLESHKALECLNSPLDYVPPKYLIKQLQEEIKKINKGIISIHMERGCGKSAFSHKMSSFFNEKSLLKNSFTRCYHISHANLRGIYDFVNTLNFEFRNSFKSSDGFYSSNIEIPVLSTHTQTAAKDMAEFLNFFHTNRHRNEGPTILILDGIDEITTETEQIIDFIPSADLLVDNVFVILMSRFEKEKTVLGESKKYIKKCDMLSQQSRIEIERKNEDNIRLMRSFIRKQKKNTKFSDEVTDKLIKKADYRFLYLKAYLAINNLDLKYKNEVEFLDGYMNYLFTAYGKTRQRKIIRLAVYIALFPHFSLEKYREYLGCDEITYELIGFLNDLLPLLTVFHVDGESFYEFSDISYLEYIIKKYQTESSEIINSLFLITQSTLPYEVRQNDLSYSEYRRLLFYLESVITIWNKTSESIIIRKSFYESTEVIHIVIQFVRSYNSRYGYGNSLIDKISEFLKSMVDYAVENCEAIDLTDIVTLIGDKLSQYEVNVRREINSLICKIIYNSETNIDVLENLYLYFLSNIQKIDNMKKWLWIILFEKYKIFFDYLIINNGTISFFEDPRDNIPLKNLIGKTFTYPENCVSVVQYIIDNDYLRLFTEYLMEYSVNYEAPDFYSIREWINDIFPYASSESDKEYLLNKYIYVLLLFFSVNNPNIDENSYDFANEIKDFLFCIKSIREKKSKIDASILGHFFNLDFDQLPDEKLIPSELRKKLLLTSIDILKKKNLNFEQCRIVYYGLRCYEYYGTNSYRDLEKSLYNYFLQLKDPNKQMEFFLYYGYWGVNIFESGAEEKEDISDLVAWIKIAQRLCFEEVNAKKKNFNKNFIKEKYGLLQFLFDSMIFTFEWMDDHNKKDDALNLMEEFVFKIDAAIFNAYYNPFMNKLELCMNDDRPFPRVFCTNNVLCLLDYYYKNDYKDRLSSLLDEIEDSIGIIIHWMEKMSPGEREKIEIELYQFVFSHGPIIEFEERIDTKIQCVIEEHSSKINNILLTLSPYSDYYGLECRIKSILNYAWIKGDFQYSFNFCETIKKLLNDVYESNDNPIVLKSIKELIVFIDKYYQLFYRFTKSKEKFEKKASSQTGKSKEKKLEICEQLPYLKGNKQIEAIERKFINIFWDYPESLCEYNSLIFV